jgi:hypothetical protein
VVSHTRISGQRHHHTIDANPYWLNGEYVGPEPNRRYNAKVQKAAFLVGTAAAQTAARYAFNAYVKHKDMTRKKPAPRGGGAPIMVHPVPTKAQNKNKNKQAVRAFKAPSRSGPVNYMLRAPVMRTQGGRAATRVGGAAVERREFIKNVTTVSDEYAVGNSIQISPSSFSWSAPYVNMYDSFVVEEFQVEYIPNVSTAETGYVALTIDFDPEDGKPLNLNELLNSKGAVSGPPWAPLTYKCSRRDLSKRSPLYTGSKGSGSIRNTAAGRVVFASGHASSSGELLGQLWVSYRIRFETPQLINIASGGNTLESGGAAGIGSTSSSNAAPFGTVDTFQQGTLPATWTYDGTTTSDTDFTFTEPWSGMVNIRVVGTGLSTTSYSGSTATVAEVHGLSSATQLVRSWSLVAQPGEMFRFECPNTTITEAQIYFTRGPTLSHI